MLNIIELESRWFKYKIRSYLPHFTILISLVIITTLIFSFTKKPSVDSKYKGNIISEIHTSTPIVLPEVLIQKKDAVKEKTVVKKQTTIVVPSINKDAHANLKLSPSLDFMKKMQNSVQPYYMNEKTNSDHYTDPDSDTSSVVSKPVTPNKLLAKTVNIQQTPKKIHIKRQNTQNDIYDIIKRFKNNNNPALSLFVAKKYYELGNYNQSYNYSLITNKINKEIEVSWIIFAKSLVKLGKKDKAISTLKKYIKQSHSSSAQILLDEIRTGKFQ